LFIELCIELPDELIHAQGFHVGHVNVTDLSIGFLIYDFPVMINPCFQPEFHFVADWFHCHFVLILSVRGLGQCQCNLLTHRIDKEAVWIGRCL
jgi:hypothetical protein